MKKMKKIKLFTMTLIAMLLVIGCQKDEEVKIATDVNFVTLDLTDSNQTYAKAYDILSNNENIRLITENNESVLNGFHKDLNSTSEFGEFYISENDSISIMISTESISIISQCTAEEEKFLIHKDPEVLKSYYVEYMNSTEKFIATRSSDEVPATVKMNNPSILSIKGGAIKTNNGREILPNYDEDMAKYKALVNENVATRAAYPDRDMSRIRIWLIRASGYNYLSHEIAWSQQHVYTMMRDIKWDVQVDFYTRGSNFEPTTNAYSTLDKFKSWLQTQYGAGHDWSDSINKDILHIFGASASVFLSLNLLIKAHGELPVVVTS